jgi:hypothetical protein
MEAKIKKYKFMYKKFTSSVTGANNCSPMESGDHFKNGVSPKNLMSRGNFKTVY